MNFMKPPNQACYRSHVLLILGVVLSRAFVNSSFSAPIQINFDDRPGMRPPFSQGQPVPLQYMVSTQYHSLGVLFNSAGGGIRISAPPNPVSAPNVAGATE